MRSRAGVCGPDGSMVCVYKYFKKMLMPDKLIKTHAKFFMRNSATGEGSRGRSGQESWDIANLLFHFVRPLK